MTTNLKCFLCLIPCGPPDPGEDCENLKDKLRLLINYVAVTATRKSNSSSSSLSFCKKCKALLESFSTSHGELELAIRKVDSCVEKICDVMLDGNNQREKDMRNESMRKDILEKSSLKIKKSQPETTKRVKRVRFAIGDDDTPSSVEVTPPPTPSSPTSSSSSSSPEKIKMEPGRKLPDFIWEQGTAIRYRKEVTLYYCSICDKEFTAKDFPFHQSHSAFYDRLCTPNSQKQIPTESQQSPTSTSEQEPEVNDTSNSTGSETGVVVKTEENNKTTPERRRSPLEETLPYYIIRKSCIQRDDHVETLFQCNRCNKIFFSLNLHLKIHGITIAPELTQNQSDNLGGGHAALMEVDTPDTTTSESGTNTIGLATTAPENRERSETVTPVAVHQEQEDVETPSTSDRCSTSEQKRFESMMEIDLGDIKLAQEELVWSYDNQSHNLKSNDKGSKSNETGLTSGVVPQPSQDDDDIIKMGTKKAKDGKSTSDVYLCRKCNFTFAISPDLHRQKKRHQDAIKALASTPTPAATATATPESSNRRKSQSKSSESDKLKVLQTKKIERNRNPRKRIRSRKLPPNQATATSTGTNRKSPAELPDFITSRGTIYKFNQKQTLYYCSECKMEFPSSNLTIHKRKHGIGRLGCGKCDRTFYTKQDLLKHTKTGQCNKNKNKASEGKAKVLKLQGKGRRKASKNVAEM